MSESEATTGVGDSSMDGEKVKAINGMKEVDDVRRMQNGEAEKPQINGDVEKNGKDGESGEAREGESSPAERNGRVDDDAEMKDGEADLQETEDDRENMEDGGGGGADEGGGDSGEVEEKEGESTSTSQGEEEEEEEEEEDDDEEEDEEREEGVAKAEEEEEEEEEEEGGVTSTLNKEGEEEGAEEKKKKEEEEEKMETKEDEDAEEKAKDDESEAKTKPDTSSSSSTSTTTTTATTSTSTNSDTTTTTTTTNTTTTTTSSSTSTPTPTTPTTGKKKKSHSDIQEVLPTRQLRARRTPKKYTEEDDDVKITNEVIRDDSSDIEMIEESDPLAISDAEVKKIQKEKKEITIKTKDPNVIIIDTNTLLKNQGNLAAAVAQSTSSTPVQTITNRSTSTSTTTTTNLNIQSAIQAITGGAPAQGLQSAYITALQQVLLSQGGQVPMNSQHLSQLQQYYNSLGHLQDDAYVIEAPSFIVPYVMEGKPKEPIKEFLKRINKELEEFERKEKEEEERKAAEEKKRKEEEEKQKRKEEREAEKKRRIEVGESIEDIEKEEEEERAAEAKQKEEEEEAEEKRKKEKEASEKKVKDEKKEEEEDKENNKSSTNKEDGKKEGEKDGKVQSKDEKDGEKKGKEEKATETVDEDKENKDKSDTESVIDLEKESKDKEDMSYLGKWEPYYRSALGKFMLELGLNQAQEFLQADLLRMQKRKLEKMKTNPSREGIMAVKLLEKQLDVTRKKNAHLHVPLKICKFCTFKTESEMVMERHLESPHMANYTYKCNFCEFETRGPQVILFHMEAEHNTRGRLERAPAFFQCSLCPYEDNNKSKMTRHSFSCSKKYKPEKNCELIDWEPPAKIPKIHRGRPNTLGKAFEPVKMPNLLPKNLAGMNISIQSAGGTGLLPSSTLSIAAGRGRGRPVGSYKNPGPLPSQARGINTVSSGSLLYTNRGTTTTTTVQGSGSQQFTLGNQMFHSTARVQRILPSGSSNSPVSLIPGLGASSSITIQSVQSKGGNSKSPQQPSISITPLPRAGQQLSQGGGSKGSSTGRGDSGSNPSFVICEICDGYIKDLEQLRNHMNLIHKVKIHPKMIYNRPPLNCQKCQHRFFTDQGLERHLLGTHGLVTSSMQEAANKGKDAGRCPICGKVFQWKLLNHVSRDHKMTLKPAHLSYKCTVCTATFNMYRLFENHVYSAHSVVNKNKEGGKKQSSSSSSGGGSSESPLKINDEITIIPQPVVSKSKGSTSNSSSNTSSSTSSSNSSDKLSSSKKSDSSTPTMSKEITITKVGSRPTRRSGGSSSVEVISLDESPKKNDSSNKKRAHKDNVGNNTKKARTSS